ncbi:MAG: hypothetical protein JF587_09670 [Catenulisporales bacterium]|jgi:hypothetical protein|nr:hypothetical protein [Catenulisporales bacterium]
MTEDGNPDDATLIAALNTERTDAWRAIVELDEDFRNRPHADDDCVWLPHYPQYGARVQTACRLLGELGAVTPAYHWMQRKPPALGIDGTVSPADAIRLATTVIRSERFGYGNIEGALTAGILQAVIAALAAWHREQAG